jgi:hypothetical protein
MSKDLWLNNGWIPAYAGMTIERSRTQLAPAPAYCIEILRHILIYINYITGYSGDIPIRLP